VNAPIAVNLAGDQSAWPVLGFPDLPTPASVLCWGIDAGPFGIIKNHFSSNGSSELQRMLRNYAKSGRKYCADVRERDKSFGQQSP
jgi:hypothetical protein